MTEVESHLCYFLVCFQRLDFVQFLLSSLYRTDDLYFIHCDKKSPPDLKAWVAQLAGRYSNIRLIESQDYSWAGYSHVRVCLQAIRRALAEQEAWSHFIFLSEQHLPLKTPAEIGRALGALKSVFTMRPVTAMRDDEWADIESRFGATYRELPGVGCFAVALQKRDDAFYAQIFHGSNWIVVHRDHCRSLIDAESAGKFEPFEQVVHAEETAIQTMLSSVIHEIVPFDPTVVAWPNVTDNNSLVMTDQLFLSAASSNHLFIRKRKDRLSKRVYEHIVGNHHFEFGLSSNCIPAEKDALSQESDDLCHEIGSMLRAKRHDIEIIRLDNATLKPSPQIYLILRTAALSKDLTVRVLSENLKDFKVSIISDRPFSGLFERPWVRDGFLHSTVRVRVYALFGTLDILPVDAENGGFCRLEPHCGPEPLLRLISFFLQAASHYSATGASGFFAKP